MGSYESLAACYDGLTYDVDYSAWADYVEKHFARRGLPGRTVLDLACGTGSLTWELARRGYEMIGVDRSPDMLARAAEKDGGGAAVRPLFLCQSMEKLDLYGTVDACVCCLDSVNYVPSPGWRAAAEAGGPGCWSRRSATAASAGRPETVSWTRGGRTSCGEGSPGSASA